MAAWNSAHIAASLKHSRKFGRPFWLTLPMFRCSPRKLYLIANAISGISVTEAILQCRFITKKAAIPVYDVLCQIRSRIRDMCVPHEVLMQGFDARARIQGGKKDEPLKPLAERMTPEMHAKANALLARYSIIQAVVGRGTYLRRIDIKGRGRRGIISHPHAMMRIQVGILDEEKRVRKLLRMRDRIQENKPIYWRRIEYHALHQ